MGFECAILGVDFEVDELNGDCDECDIKEGFLVEGL